MSDYELLARTYDLEFGLLTEDIPFWTDLARSAGGPALELAVGTGRVAIPVARSGVPVTGVDGSPAMLAVLAGKLAAEPGLPLAAFPGDMRDFDLRSRGPFAVVYVPFRAFLHLLTPVDQLAALANVRRHLKPGGLFAGAVFFPDMNRIAKGHLPFAFSHEYRSPGTGRRCVVSDSVRYDVRAVLIRACFRTEELTDAGEVVSTSVREIVLTWIWPRELEHLLARAGFELVDLFGDFARTPFAKGGGEMVFVARSRA